MSLFRIHGLSLALRITHPDTLMAPTTPRPVRRKVHKPRFRPKRNRIEKLSSPKSPCSPLARRHVRPLLKQARIAKAANGRGTVTKPKSVDGRASPRIVKYQIASLWSSSEPFEKNCLQREPLPDDYIFVPRGNIYLTRNCRSKTKETHRLVYKVYDNAGKKPIGIRIPSDVHATVTQSAEETAESRANAVKLRDEKDIAHSRQLLCKKFPLMPAGTLDVILDHAFLKGSGRVGRTSTTSDEHKAVLAVEAHIRHMHTPYESLLRAGKSRLEARNAVWETVRTIRAAWEGHGAETTLLTMR